MEFNSKTRRDCFFSIGYVFSCFKQLNDVNWNCSVGIGSNQSFNLTGNNETVVLIAYNYSSDGTKELTCYANATDGYENKTTDFEIKGLEIQNYTLTDLSTNTKRIKFNIYNHYYPLTVNWEVKSDTTHTGSVSLSTDEVSTVTQDITYTTDGDKTVNISVYSGSIRDSEEYEFEIEALEIDRYDRYNFNTTKRIISFILTNQWPDNLSVTWNLSNPVISNSTYLVLVRKVLYHLIAILPSMDTFIFSKIWRWFYVLCQADNQGELEVFS